MDSIDFSAHAYLVRSGSDDALYRLIGILSERGVETKGNPDCYVREYESFSVDDARDVSNFAYFKPVGARKYIVLCTKSMTIEAQNALLKIVEEGSGRSVFFFVLPLGVPVLSTLESRCVSVKAKTENGKEEGEDFLKKSYAKRLALAEKFAKDHDREGARELVRSLLILADTKKFDAKTLRDLLDADRSLQLSGSSPKSIIGHLALVL